MNIGKSNDNRNLTALVWWKISIVYLALAFLLYCFLCSAGNSNNSFEWSSCNESIIDGRAIFIILAVFFPKVFGHHSAVVFD